MGSASDHIFESQKEVTYSLAGTLLKSLEDENHFFAWTIFSSNNSAFLPFIPLPGFAYFFKTETAKWMLGFPITNINWNIAGPWNASFLWLVTNFQGEIARNILFPRQQVFIQANWQQNSFLRAERTNTQDRIVYDEKRILVGIRSPLTRQFSAELQIGHIFDASLYEGTAFFNRRGGNTDIRDNTYIQAQFRWTNLK